MRPHFLIVACITFMSVKASAQEMIADTISKNTTQSKVIEEDNKVYTSVEVNANFKGGMAGWSKYLQKRIQTFRPEKQGAPKGKYPVVVRFVVGKNGKIKAVDAETKFGYGMETALKRVISQSPSWIPAMQNGQPVNVYRKQPLTFVVQ